MCVPSFSTLGIFMLLTSFLILLILDSIISVWIFSKKAINFKNFVRIFAVVAPSWLLTVGVLQLIVIMFDENYVIVRYAAFIIPGLTFIAIRSVIFKKLLKTQYIRSIILSIIILVLFSFVFTQTAQIINERYNRYCYSDAILF